jgi:cardiolipin synthase
MGHNDSRGNGKIIKFPNRADMEREYLSADAPSDEETPPTPLPEKPPSLGERLITFKARSSLVRRAIAALPRWITPNGVTLFRMALAVPIIWLLRGEHYWAAFGISALAFALDFVDGAIAAVRGEQSESGAFLDPLADKVLVCGILLALTGRVPEWMTLAAVGITAVAVAITMVRILKMARASRRYPKVTNGVNGPVPGSHIAAKKAGKLKMICEVAAILIAVAGLALGSPPIVVAGGVAVVAALALGCWSFLNQLFE